MAFRWEKINDPRHKYENQYPELKVLPFSVPKWNKVWMEESQRGETPLGPDWKFNYCLLEARYEVYMKEIMDFEVSPDDVWVISYPKSGTTWTQEMVWLICNNFDFEKAKSTTQYVRSPTLRQVIQVQTDVEQRQKNFDLMNLNHNKQDIQGPPYVIKNHLPAGFLPRSYWKAKPKTIYVARNPKDVAVSFYHHYKNVYQYVGTLEEFMGLFLDGLIEFAPICDHIREFWHLRDEPNVLFLTYEEMKKDLGAVIRKTCDFLGKTVTEEQLEGALTHLDIKNMRENVGLLNGYMVPPEAEKLYKEFTDRFFRKGDVGGHKKEMPADISERFDRMIKEGLKGCGLYE